MFTVHFTFNFWYFALGIWLGFAVYFCRETLKAVDLPFSGKVLLSLIIILVWPFVILWVALGKVTAWVRNLIGKLLGHISPAWEGRYWWLLDMLDFHRGGWNRKPGDKLDSLASWVHNLQAHQVRAFWKQVTPYRRDFIAYGIRQLRRRLSPLRVIFSRVEIEEGQPDVVYLDKQHLAQYEVELRPEFIRRGTVLQGNGGLRYQVLSTETVYFPDTFQLKVVAKRLPPQ